MESDERREKRKRSLARRSGLETEKPSRSVAVSVSVAISVSGDLLVYDHQ